MTFHRISVTLALATCLHAGPATAAIDLQDFYDFGDEGTLIFFSADGMSADLVEGNFATVLLENDPVQDPTIIEPAAGNTLKFDYDFQNPTGENSFLARLTDPVSYDVPGNPLRFDLPAAGYDFSTQVESSGTVSFDLGPLAGAFSELGMQFWLMTQDGDAAIDSSVTVSNLRITAVPVPGAAVLLLSALVGLTAFGRRRRGRA